MPDHFPERTQHWNQLAARDEAKSRQQEEEKRKEETRRKNMQNFENQPGKTYYRPIVITHFDDQIGSHDNKLGYGDIAVANKGMKHSNDPFPKGKDSMPAYPMDKSVIIYYDTGETLPAKVGDWGRGNFKQSIPPENWIDVWDPVRTKKQVNNKGWVAFKTTQKPPDAVEKPTWGNYGIIDQAPAVRKR